MAMAVEITMVIALVLSIIVPGVSFLKGQRTKSRFKSHLAVNVVTFFGLLIVATVSILAGNTSALAATASSGSGFATGMGYIAAALSVGISCIGGGIAVASAASAALGAISEDQSILGKSLIYVGLAEGVCLYGLIIAFMIIGSL
ncbi:MAG: ATP synthase subunit C [Eubacteriales bacterium]|nr:ATP synthase subunit C [Eubacteriales bacterium]